MATQPQELPPLTRKREGQHGPFSDQITLKSAFFGALSNAETIRKGKGKGRGRGKGKGRHPGGSAAGSTNAEDYIYGNKVEIQQVKCHFCQQTNIEGTHKCQSCFKWLIAWSDGRIATEVCRMEIVAKKTNKVFSLDKIDFEKQPRSQRVSDRTRADLRRAGRSNFGNLKDAAQTHAGRYGKMGVVSIRFRIECNVILTILSTTPWHRSPQTVANSWKSWPSACRPTWADHEKRGKSNWEQVSAQG